MKTKRIIVGVTGASGAPLAAALLSALKTAGYETHLVATEGAKLTWELETGRPVAALYALADRVYESDDQGAAIASGTFATEGMIVAPCSMKTLSGIVSGYAENLLLRAADVCMKEGRRLVLLPRETPMSRVHLRNLAAAAELGCAVVPPVLTFYNGADTVEKQIAHIVGKTLGLFGIETEDFVPWKGTER